MELQDLLNVTLKLMSTTQTEPVWQWEQPQLAQMETILLPVQTVILTIIDITVQITLETQAVGQVGQMELWWIQLRQV